MRQQLAIIKWKRIIRNGEWVVLKRRLAILSVSILIVRLAIANLVVRLTVLKVTNMIIRLAILEVDILIVRLAILEVAILIVRLAMLEVDMRVRLAILKVTVLRVRRGILNRLIILKWERGIVDGWRTILIRRWTCILKGQRLVSYAFRHRNALESSLPSRAGRRLLGILKSGHASTSNWRRLRSDTMRVGILKWC